MKMRWLMVVLFVTGCDRNDDSKKVLIDTHSDLLPSLNYGEVKKSIIDYVRKATLTCSANFMLAKLRGSVCDNAGTVKSFSPQQCFRVRLLTA